MGAIADSVLKSGGHVIGVIPEQILELEVAHTGLSELIKVEDMHTRKKPFMIIQIHFWFTGWFWNLDELFEVLTLNQLSIHKRGYSSQLKWFFDNLLLLHLVSLLGGFLASGHRALVEVFCGL